MSRIIKTTAEVITTDWESDWYNADSKSDSDKEVASNGTTPKEFIVQAGLLDVTGTPDANSKIQILSTIQGQSETIEYEQAITADNINDAWSFDGIKGNAIKVKAFIGGLDSFKLAVDYDAIY
ncbi:MAG: hypothetical protein WC121_10750 [Candidatus Kapaibacterium sp.]